MRRSSEPSGIAMSDIVRELLAALGAEAVLSGGAVEDRHAADWSGLDPARPLAVVKPRSTAEVATALRLCHARGQTVVPQGGLTGLAGGATPRARDIAVALERLRGIEEIDADAATMTVLAGTPLEEAQRAAEAAGFYLALDLGARGSCQVGGNVATNAGGNRVIRYGMAREQVLGLEAVLADGTVLDCRNKMLKNNAGYDLKQLFIGSEGTLGIVTRVVLRLHPRPRGRATAFAAAPGYAAVVALLRRAQGALGGVSAFEALWPDFYRFVTDHPDTKSKPLPDGSPFYLLIEHLGFDPAADAARFEALLAEALAAGEIADAVIAQSDGQAREFWVVREGLAIDTLPGLINFDVSLPIGAIGDFAERCGQALRARWPTAHVFFYGHIGDSNLHISVAATFGPGESIHDVDDIVYGEVRARGGSISAEHGIGRLKRDYLGHCRAPAELALMQALKAALDPRGILNPGKVL
jgi:FAD/FMN-containing dehydrogenase